MGKAARERAKRAAAEAAPPELILPPTPPPEPQAIEETPPPEKPGWMCRVRGCKSLALERHEAPSGVVWLCGSCGRIARHNLSQEALAEKFRDQVAALHIPVLEAYEEARRVGRERADRRLKRKKIVRPAVGDVAKLAAEHR